MYFKCISYFQLSIILCSVLKGEMYISDKFDDVVQLNVSFFVQCCSGEEPPSVDGVRG